MRFLVDESSDKLLANLMKQAGYDTIFVGDAMPTASDEKVLDSAEKESRVLISDDKDFGELIFRLSRPTSGVILLRTLTTDPERRFEMIKDVLDKAEGKFIVVKEGRTRVKEL